jgi:serine/threonine-protein kinase
VLVDEEGSAKVTDFGIARSLDQSGLTADGRVLGTTDYVSPEQALGHDVSGQSDLYSLGVVLFEMLTGEVPFQGENQVAVAMKHVREELPDVQVRRPEISAALAAVLDRATAKELDRRYQSAETMIADLEDVLSIETARSGQVTGEATTVLRSLPGSARRRLPLRLRRSAKALAAVVALAVAAIVLVAVLAADRTERGTGERGRVAPPPGLQEVVLGQRAADDYDPLGGDGEHADQATAVVDGDRQSTWSTEGYSTGDLQKPGVGIIVDAAPGVAARQLEIQTPTPGFSAEVYVARDGVPPTAPGQGPGWTRVGAADRVGAREKIDLDTAGRRFRRYLVWITKLPEGAERAAISEILLFR